MVSWVIVSVCAVVVLVLVSCVNLCANTSWMIFCASADRAAFDVVILPLLMATTTPATLTVQSGGSGGAPGTGGGGGARFGTGIWKSISTSTAVPRIPMVATGVSIFMSPCLAVSPATNEMVPATRLSNDEWFDPL